MIEKFKQAMITVLGRNALQHMDDHDIEYYYNTDKDTLKAEMKITWLLFNEVEKAMNEEINEQDNYNTTEDTESYGK